MNAYHWRLRRAVDHHGAVLDVLVQSRRNPEAAKCLMGKIIRTDGFPRPMITGKLKSYGTGKDELSLKFERCQHKGLNKRFENWHQTTRAREKEMRQFKSAGPLQLFVSTHDQVANAPQHCR